MKVITVPAQIKHVNDVFIFVKEEMTNAGIDTKTQKTVRIAVEEILVNIASYAYPSEVGDVTVSITTASDKCIVKFEDSGIPYDPLDNSGPETNLSLDERDIGGLGIFMTKELMDNVEYSYENGQNILIITKNP